LLESNGLIWDRKLFDMWVNCYWADLLNFTVTLENQYLLKVCKIIVGSTLVFVGELDFIKTAWKKSWSRGEEIFDVNWKICALHDHRTNEEIREEWNI